MKSTLRKKHLRGYTIVELLVVVVVIVILSSIALLSYNGIQDRAKYAALRQSITAVERAFKMKAIADGGYKQDIYYQSCIGSGINNPLIGDIIDKCKDENPLSNYLRSSDFSQFGGPMWYDNDMDTYQGSCDSAFNTGVNILFKQYSDNSGKNQIPATLFNQLDIDMDSGNGMQCGKVRANAQQYYTMSPSYDTY